MTLHITLTVRDHAALSLLRRLLVRSCFRDVSIVSQERGA